MRVKLIGYEKLFSFFIMKLYLAVQISKSGCHDADYRLGEASHLFFRNLSIIVFDIRKWHDYFFANSASMADLVRA